MISKNRCSHDDVLKAIDLLLKQYNYDSVVEQLCQSIRDCIVVSGGIPNLSPLLPLFLSLKGNPYTISDHFPFEPFFHTAMARKLVLLCGRQLSKSTSLAAQGIIISNCIPFFNTLFIAPQFETIRRFSNNYVKAFIDQSPVKNLLTTTESSANVLQRSFSNHSAMFFSFAFLDCDRTRGIPADRVSYDEVQDLDATFLPIIRETMGASKWKQEQYAGTPKTMENTIQKLFERSSQAEWVIPCDACGYENVPALSHDLEDMVGPWHEGISEETPGVVCASHKCKRPINPRKGRWFHRYPNRAGDFTGLHVPQQIMPMHYADSDAWGALVGKAGGAGNTPKHVYYNEVCGESWDTGSKLLTQSELMAASHQLWPNDLETAARHIGRYKLRFLGIDWGGGGEDEISFTTYAVIGWLPNGDMEVIYGHRSLQPHDHIGEARIALNLVKKFHCQYICHDYSGAGEYREKYIADAGFPLSRLTPISYVRAAAQQLMFWVPGDHKNPRDRYRLDKPRSLVMLCYHIKMGNLRFFNYDYRGDDDTGLLHDFLALVEDKSNSRLGGDIYTIIRQPNMTDDFAHAVNYAACGLWYHTQTWPDVARAEKFNIRRDLLNALSPPIEETRWDDYM